MRGGERGREGLQKGDRDDRDERHSTNIKFKIGETSLLGENAANSGNCEGVFDSAHTLAYAGAKGGYILGGTRAPK